MKLLWYILLNLMITTSMWTSEHTKVSIPRKRDDYDDEANDDNGERQSNKTPGHTVISD